MELNQQVHWGHGEHGTRGTPPVSANVPICLQLMDLKLTVDGLEKERDFYFSKLRDIELICQEHENENSPIISGIVSVLYATEVRALCALLRSPGAGLAVHRVPVLTVPCPPQEGFAPPEDDELEEQQTEEQDEY